MVPPDSHEISGVPCYLGTRPRETTPYIYTTITLYGPPSQAVQLQCCFITPRPLSSAVKNGPTTPHMQHLPALTHARFSLLRFRSPLLTESQLFSSPMGTEMFHFPTFPPTPLYIQDEVAGHDSGPFEVSLFGHPRIKARLPTPRGLSQVTTSFIGS